MNDLSIIRVLISVRLGGGVYRRILFYAGGDHLIGNAGFFRTVDLYVNGLFVTGALALGNIHKDIQSAALIIFEPEVNGTVIHRGVHAVVYIIRRKGVLLVVGDIYTAAEQCIEYGGAHLTYAAAGFCTVAPPIYGGRQSPAFLFAAFAGCFVETEGFAGFQLDNVHKPGRLADVVIPIPAAGQFFGGGGAAGRSEVIIRRKTGQLGGLLLHIRHGNGGLGYGHIRRDGSLQRSGIQSGGYLIHNAVVVQLHTVSALRIFETGLLVLLIPGGLVAYGVGFLFNGKGSVGSMAGHLVVKRIQNFPQGGLVIRQGRLHTAALHGGDQCAFYIISGLKIFLGQGVIKGIILQCNGNAVQGLVQLLGKKRTNLRGCLPAYRHTVDPGSGGENIRILHLRTRGRGTAVSVDGRTAGGGGRGKQNCLLCPFFDQ